VQLLLGGFAVLSFAENRLETIIKQTEREFGRVLTAREKFYLALSEACSPPICNLVHPNCGEEPRDVG
jgi:hypothetical protein